MSSQSTRSSFEIKLSKNDFKFKKLSGAFKGFDPQTGNKEEGSFRDGAQIGIWKVVDFDGDEAVYEYKPTNERSGAICRDGTLSSATGRGACSYHGGVDRWLTKTQKIFIKGTGKFCPASERIKTTREAVKVKFNIDGQGQNFQLKVLEALLKMAKEKEIIQYENEQLKAQINNKKLEKPFKQQKEQIKQTQKIQPKQTENNNIHQKTEKKKINIFEAAQKKKELVKHKQQDQSEDQNCSQHLDFGSESQSEWEDDQSQNKEDEASQIQYNKERLSILQDLLKSNNIKSKK